MFFLSSVSISILFVSNLLFLILFAISDIGIASLGYMIRFMEFVLVIRFLNQSILSGLLFRPCLSDYILWNLIYYRFSSI